ncbi:MAG: TIGR01777 family oxidoreductase [Gemmatimonadales bacterium]
MIVISGSTGLIGSALVASLTARGHEVRQLVRRTQRGGDEITWHPDAGELDPRAFDGADAVIHLAGENIAQRWTSGARQRIRDSRVHGTSLIARTIAALPRKPRALVNASAIGIYGDRGDEELDEWSATGRGFLANVCREWEAATSAASDAGVRVAMLRTGVALSRGGGALAKLLPPFRAGLGGRIGSGRQWMSWIALSDLVRAVLHIVDDETLAGPVDIVAPNPVRNADFARTLGRVLRRPAVIPLPGPAIRLLFGAMGVETLLASQRVRPAKLLERGFAFEHPTLESALRREI